MKGSKVAVVAIVFVVVTIALAFVFGALFDSYALGIGPAIAVAAGFGMAAYIAVREKET